MAMIVCVPGDLNPHVSEGELNTQEGEISLYRGNHTDHATTRIRASPQDFPRAKIWF